MPKLYCAILAITGRYYLLVRLSLVIGHHCGLISKPPLVGHRMPQAHKGIHFGVDLGRSSYLYGDPSNKEASFVPLKPPLVGIANLRHYSQCLKG